MHNNKIHVIILSIYVSSIYIVRLSMTSARSKGVTHRSRKPRIRAIYHFFIFVNFGANARFP